MEEREERKGKEGEGMKEQGGWTTSRIIHLFQDALRESGKCIRILNSHKNFYNRLPEVKPDGKCQLLQHLEG